MNTKKHILLTGAGFTKNFGAPLAAEVWSIILGSADLEGMSAVRAILLNDFDFESVYYQVLNGTLTDDEKSALTGAVQTAYAYIDSTISTVHGTDINLYGVQKFIARFAGDRLRPGFFFTLNQDLFVERHYYNGDRPSVIGTKHRDRWFSSSFNTGMQASDLCELPQTVPSAKEILDRVGFAYIKLHGSMNWYPAGSGRQKMVIGRGKEAQIESEPLLSRYFEIFREVLCSEPHKLLVIGYGFADPHINRVLVESMEMGLELFVLSPGNPQELKKNLECNGCLPLWQALREYFPFDLKTLFPADQTVTPQWKHVQRVYFDDQHGLLG